jgi:RimJ/RimL family protein N-acetyltransferase
VTPEGTLFVFARNTPARAFYERRGCRVVGTGDGSGNEEREPDVEYAWAP